MRPANRALASAVATLAQYTFREALHSRIALAAIAAALAGVALAAFAGQLALTDSAGIRIATLAVVSRLAAVFLIASFTIAALVREHDDKGLELLLSLPLPRAGYLAGKWLGVTAAAFALAILFTGPLMLDAPPSMAAAWGASLALELTLVASASLFCVVTITQLAPCLAAVAAFYCLSRVIGAVLAITASPAAPTDAATFGAATEAVHVIAALLPRLDLYTQTAWLTGDAGPAAVFPAIIAQTALYATLLFCAAAIDLARKSV